MRKKKAGVGHKRASAVHSKAAGPMESELESKVRERFGVLPNFFRLTPENPRITENLWGFACSAYLDNPLPSLFKERLFVYLSRFCEVRYCIARHVGFLAGLGHAAGDAQSPRQSIEQIVRLLRRALPRGQELEQLLSGCGADSARLIALIDGKSSAGKGSKARSAAYDEDAETIIFGLISPVFLQTANAPACLEALRALLGESRVQHLMVFLAFVRTAHYRTKLHPELALEDDISELLKTHKSLAQCVLGDAEVAADELSRRLLDELASLRRQTERDTGLMTAIVDSSDDAIISKNLDGFITSWNRGAERLFGYTAQEAVGQHVTLIIPPERHDEETRILEQLRRGKRIDHFETVRIRKDGAKLDVSLTISPVRDAADRIIGASKVARDVTGRKQAARSIAEQARLLDLSYDAILVRDASDRITYWNKGASELYGYTPEEALGQVTHELLRTQFPEPLERITQHLQREGRWTGELIHKRKDGAQIVVSSRWALDRDNQGKTQSILETNNDVTARKEAEDALRRSEKQLRLLADGLEEQVQTRTQELEQRNREILERSELLRLLSIRLLQVQDDERRQIARELHDSIGQYLTGLIMALGEVKRQISGNSNVEEAIEIAQKCLAEIRTISHLLHPPLLEEAGLASAVRWYVDGFAERSGIRATVEIPKPLRRLEPEIELAVFRILQESLTNVHRHSGSKSVDIRIGLDSRQVWLEIEDQGKGRANGSAHEGVGITGMRERVGNLGGEFGITSTKSGTRVRVILPLARPSRSVRAASRSARAAH